MDRLTIFHNDNGTIRDLTNDLESYGRDPVVFDYTLGEDYLYIGYEKQIERFYVEMNVDDDQNTDLSMEYFNGTTWEPVTGLIDQTKGFIRSGFVIFDRMEDHTSSEVDSITRYWLRISFSATLNPLTAIQGINIVFSDDEDLKEVWNDIDEFKLEDQRSFILKHQSSKKEIIQDLRNGGRRKIKKNSERFNHINAFDLILIDEEVREASKYLTLANIFFNVSNDPDGVHRENARKMEAKYANAINNFYDVSIDDDDDGKEDSTEHVAIRSKIFRRI